MTTFKLSLRTICKAAVFLLFLILFTTCDVGLGPSVDTTAPEVNIESPTPSQIMNGVIQLGGVASDDGQIASVTVNLKGIGTTSALIDYNASFADGRWSLSVDTLNGTEDVNGAKTPR